MEEKVVFVTDYGIALRALTRRLQNFNDIREYAPEEYTNEIKKEHEELVKTFLTERAINLKALHKCIEEVYNLPPMEQFYKMPLYMFLAMKAVEYIRKEQGIYE